MATILSIPKALRDKLGEEASESLADLLVRYGKDMESSIVTLAAERFERKLTSELSDLREQMHTVETTLRQEMKDGDAALREALVETRGFLQTEIRATEARMTRWMFIFWIGQVGAILGILFAFFR